MNHTEFDQPMRAPVSARAVDERAAFLTRTYLHLAGAIFAFVALLTVLFMSPIPEMIAPVMMGGNMSWMIVLGLFMGVSWLAHRWAYSDVSIGMQYAGLGLYVVAEAVIFVPLIMMALAYGAEGGDTFGILKSAAGVTLALFAGLSGIVFVTRKNFSFMKSGLMFLGMAAMGAIVCSLIFNFALGNWFSYGMVVFAGGTVLYNTSRVLHDYRTDQHVAASLTLFSSITLMLWYIIRIFMSRD